MIISIIVYDLNKFKQLEVEPPKLKRNGMVTTMRLTSMPYGFDSITSSIPTGVTRVTLRIKVGSQGCERDREIL